MYNLKVNIQRNSHNFNSMIKQYSKTLLTVLLAGALTTACTENDSSSKLNLDLNQVRVLVANEGQYSTGTASLSAITKDNITYANVFSEINGRPLGDVAQSISVINNQIYVTLNNSCKIEVMDSNFKSVETKVCSSGSIPGYIVYLGGDSIAVSDKNMDGKLMIMKTAGVNNSNNYLRTIETGTTVQMILSNNKLYLGGSSLRVMQLGAMNKNQMKTIKNSKGEDLSISGDSKLVEDVNGNIWMLNHNYLYCVNPRTDEVIKELPIAGVTVGEWDGRLDISPNKDQLYFTASAKDPRDNKDIIGIVTLSVNATEVPKSLKIDLTDRVKIIYNMAISPEGTIFVCDVEYGVLTRSNIHEFTTEGGKVNTFRGGIMPQYIYFN